MEILHRASQEIISAGMEPERIYTAIHRATARLMPSEAFVIALLDAHRSTINLVYAIDRGQRRTATSFPSDAGLSGYVIATGETLCVHDVTPLAQKVDLRHFGDPEAAQSLVAVPMRLGDKTFGMLSAQSYTPHAYNDDDAQLLEMLAAHAASALENARLFSAEQERSEALEALRRASLNLTASLDLDLVLQNVLESALALAPADDAHIFLYDGQHLSFGAAHWAEGVEQRSYPQPRDQGLTYTVAQTGEPQIVPDLSQHPQFARPDWTRGLAGLPLHVGEQVVGVMNVAFHHPHHFSPDEVRLLELLADHAAIAVRNAELYQSTRRQLQELKALHAIAMAGAEAINENALIERATEIIGQTLYPDNFGLLLLDGRTGQLYAHPSYNIAEPDARSRAIPLGDGITGQVFLEGRARRIDDMTQDSEAIILDPEMRSELCVPIQVGDQVIGVVNTESRRVAAFTAEDERLLATIANQLATAIEKVRLFAETTEALIREQRLNEIARAINSALDVPGILDTVLLRAAELVGADAGLLILVEEKQNELGQPHMFNLPEGAGHYAVTKGQGIVWQIIESGQSLLLSDYRQHPNARADLVALGVHGFIGAPIAVGGECIGVVVLLAMSSQTRFTSRDLALIESIGLQTGVAIQNARRYAEAQERSVRLKVALERLQALTRFKDEFIQNVSHDLQAPLAIVRGYAELLGDGQLGDLKPEQEKPIAIITRRVKMLSQLVSDITMILEVEAEQLALERLDPVKLVRGVLTDFEASAEQRGIALGAEIDPSTGPVWGDSLKLRRVLDNLIGNALKFTPGGGSVTVRLWDRADIVYLEVADTGVGIPEDQLTRIFERFYQSTDHGKGRYGGTGLGLALTQEIVQAHKGDIVVQSTVGAGTTFRVTLPRAERADQ